MQKIFMSQVSTMLRPTINTCDPRNTGVMDWHGAEDFPYGIMKALLQALLFSRALDAAHHDV